MLKRLFEAAQKLIPGELKYKKQLPKEFLHAPSNDPTVLHNLYFTNMLFSCEAITFPGCSSIRDISIDDLRIGNFRLGNISPRISRSVVISSWIRQKKKVGVGVPPYETIWLGEETENKLIKESDDELAFEQARRIISPNAPSRLTALFVAEASRGFEEWVSETFLHPRIILRFEANEVIRFGRCDPAWYNEYRTSQRKEALYSYWKGERHSQHQLWEYLIDGSIRLLNQDLTDLSNLFEHSVKQMNEDNARRRIR